MESLQNLTDLNFSHKSSQHDRGSWAVGVVPTLQTTSHPLKMAHQLATIIWEPKDPFTAGPDLNSFYIPSHSVPLRPSSVSPKQLPLTNKGNFTRVLSQTLLSSGRPRQAYHLRLDF
jgi:hypothetical protein